MLQTDRLKPVKAGIEAQRRVMIRAKFSRPRLPRCDDFSKGAFGGGVALLPVSFQSTFGPDEYERLVVLDFGELSPGNEQDT